MGNPRVPTGLSEDIAGLPSAYQDDDLAAKQFDCLVLLTQLAVLRADPAFVNLQTRITGIAAQLEELGNVPMVAAQMGLIAEAQTEEYTRAPLPISTTRASAVFSPSRA